MSEQDRARVTVAAVLRNERGEFLFVEEWVQGEKVINQPAGHLEPGESLVEAAVRETLEESAYEIAPKALLGIYQHRSHRTGRDHLRIAFRAELLGHHPHRPLDEGIVQALWLAPEQARSLNGRMRSPIVLACIEDYLAGQQFPLSLVHEFRDG